MRKNILITGMPRSGKSTLLKKLIQKFDPKVGFVTNEVREANERVGFEIETDTGKKSMLASVEFKTGLQVSRYFVDINSLDTIIPQVENFNVDDLLFLDEIGQMELFSDKFKNLVLQYLDSPNTCIATLSKVYTEEFTENLKNRTDVILVEITENNRSKQEQFIEDLLKKITKARKYVSDPHRFTVTNNEVKIITDHGTRNLIKQREKWLCDCEFFQQHHICSHFIALEEYLKNL